MPSPFNTVGTASATVLQHRLFWTLVDTLWGGTTTMRLAGRALLPQEEKETDQNYAARLARSTLDNFYREGVERAADKVFSKDIALKELTPELELWWDDVDTQGRDGTQFARECFEAAVNHGVTYILTDYARLPQDVPFANHAEEMKAGRRPYWVNIKAPSVLAADSEFIAGKERLACFRYMETVFEMDDDGLSNTPIQQIRSFHQREVAGGLPGPVEFRVYREENSDWVLHDQGLLPSFITAIPVVACYGRRTGYMLGEPVMLSLAELNVQHWRKRSDLENILHIANVPFLFGKGFGNQIDTADGGKAAPITVSIQQAVMAGSKDADLKWVEHTGTAIGTAMQDLENMEDRMRDLASSLYSNGQPNGKSATEAAINSAEANARLKSLALSLQDCLEYALFFVSAYMQVEMKGTIEVNTAYAVDFVAQETFAGVLTLFKMGIIDQEVVVAEAKRRNIIALEQDIVPPAKPPVVTADPASGDKTIIANT